MRLKVIRNDPRVGPGLLGPLLPPGSEVVALDNGDPMPEAAATDALVLLGGHMGAYDEADHPYLVAEKELVRQAVAADVPVLGICLGCQLIADALGGEAYPAAGLEARFVPCELSAGGGDDPVVRWLAEPVLSLHGDTWRCPPTGRILATSPAHPQAFRAGSALGIQPHPEVTPDVVAAWIDLVGRDEVVAAGTDPERLVAEMEAGAERSEATASALFGAWLDEIG
jgi:GMP synthase (glutamine-hydrolysing)